MLQVNIPAKAFPTVTVDGKSYLEVRVATPAGISNARLIPVKSADAAAATQVAFDLNSDSQELDVFYQWSKSNLVATEDPGSVDKNPLHITWSAPTGMAPKTLQATFSGTVGTQTADVLAPRELGHQGRLLRGPAANRPDPVPAPAGYRQRPAQLPASLSLTITVQPYIPLDSMGYRVQTKPMKLATPLTVKFVFNSTGKNALQGVNLIPPPAPPKQSAAQPLASPFDDPGQAAGLGRSGPVIDPHGSNGPRLQLPTPSLPAQCLPQSPTSPVAFRLSPPR